MNYELNESTARKVLATVDAGLVEGMGNPIPGRMCVEAAVCYAMGLPHSDRPVCVGDAVRAFVVYLNDAYWSSNAARAAGMRKLAVAQLGSERINQQAFANIVAEQTIRRIVPIALRAAAKVNPDYAGLLEDAAVRCESEGVKEAAEAARKVAYDADAERYQTVFARHTAIFAADATDANAADYAADYAAYAAATATATAAADYAAYTAERDRILRIAADIGLQALITLKSPGCDYLWLIDEVAHEH